MNYFATPVKIGRGAYEKPEFPTPESLLKHLDYLGIDRSLVFSVEAQDYSPIAGNRNLLCTLAPFKDRLIPAFVLSPADFFEFGTMDWLREQAKAGNHAYCLRPAVSRYPVRQIERVLAELAPYHPVLFLDTGYGAGESDFRDVEFLAAKYPTSHFIICKQMWGGFGTLLDLMWRCENIGVDISWLHMRDTFEMVVEQFGLDRLFFGIGHTTHYGAAVGALAHARLTQEQKEAVAHGNLEKLLGLAPLAKKLAHEPDFADKPLWKKFKEGKPLDGVKVYDVHAHLEGPTTRGWFLRETNPAAGLDAMVEFMDRHGVDKLAMSDEKALFGDILEGNREAEELVKKYPGRFMGYFVFNPWYADDVNEAVLDNFFGRGYYVGFKLLAGYWRIPYADPRYNLVWEYADKHHLPILLHTWGDAEALKTIAPKYPGAKFILGHSGGSNGGRIQSEEIAAISPNVYFEFCGTFCSTLPWEDSISKFGNTRFLFGSDAAAHNEAYELACFLSIPLPDKELEPILSANFDRILADRK